MRVVLDTNVIISAFLSPSGKPPAIVKMAIRQEFDLYLNTAILAEYEQVLTRDKFTDRIFQPEIRRFFDIIYDIGVIVDCIPSTEPLIDEGDRKFYDLARAYDAILVTGNKRHYPAADYIVDPAEFLRRS